MTRNPLETGPIQLEARIFVVDDSTPSREALIRHLQLEGWDVEGYADPVAVLDAIRTEPPDLVLLDVMMPGMTGLDVLKMIREQPTTGELPVIMLTALDDADDIVRGLDLGANDYLTKPPQLDILAARVRTQLKLKALQDQRKRDIVELRELSALKDKFLQIAAHDLRNPLGNIMMGLDVLRREIAEVAEIEYIDEILRAMQSSANIMRSIVSDFLDLQAIRAGKIELDWQEVDLNELADLVVTQYRPYAGEKEVTIRTHLDPDLPTTGGDADRLIQAISNLVSNAIKFSPPGATIGVRTRTANRRVLVEVADNGPGIPDEEIPLLFKEFSRASTRPTAGEKSSGVGLSIVSQLIDLHGGRIGVRSRVGQGSLFWFELPAVSPDGRG